MKLELLKLEAGIKLQLFRLEIWNKSEIVQTGSWNTVNRYTMISTIQLVN